MKIGEQLAVVVTIGTLWGRGLRICAGARAEDEKLHAILK